MFWKEGNGDTANDLMDAKGIYLNLEVQEGAFNRLEVFKYCEAFILITVISSKKN